MAVLALIATMLPALAGLPAQAAESEAPRVFRDCDVCPVMVEVPPGEFIMGAEGGEEGRPDGPPHEVGIKRAFAIGQFEVTNREFAAFVADTGYETMPPCAVRVGDEWLLHPEALWTDLRTGQDWAEDHPVACVNWLDARAYVAWLAEESGQPYRLPSEAEWEYAARGGRERRFPLGLRTRPGMQSGQRVRLKLAGHARLQLDARCLRRRFSDAGAGRPPAAQWLRPARRGGQPLGVGGGLLCSAVSGRHSHGRKLVRAAAR